MVEEVLASTGIAAARALEDEDAESIDAPSADAPHSDNGAIPSRAHSPAGSGAAAGEEESTRSAADPVPREADLDLRMDARIEEAEARHKAAVGIDDGTGSGRRRRRKKESEEDEVARLKRETQRMLREAAATDRIGKGYNPEIKPFTSLLAKLEARSAALRSSALSRRRPALDVSEVLAEDLAAAADVASDEELEIVEVQGAASSEGKMAEGSSEDEESEVILFDDNEDIVVDDYNEEEDDVDEQRRRKRREALMEREKEEGREEEVDGEDEEREKGKEGRMGMEVAGRTEQRREATGAGVGKDTGGEGRDVVTFSKRNRREGRKEEKESGEEAEEQEEGRENEETKEGTEEREQKMGETGLAREGSGGVVTGDDSVGRAGTEETEKEKEKDPARQEGGGKVPKDQLGEKEEEKERGLTGRDLIAMEAEMSDDGGHTDDEDDEEKDEDGNLADLIDFKARERRRDRLAREVMHVRLAEKEDEEHLEAVMRGVKTGWQTRLGRRKAGALGGDLGTDAAARRRRAREGESEEEELDAGAVRMGGQWDVVDGDDNPGASWRREGRERGREGQTAGKEGVEADGGGIDIPLDEGSRKILSFIAAARAGGKGKGGSSALGKGGPGSGEASKKRPDPHVGAMGLGSESMSLARLVGSDGLGSASLLQDSQVSFLGRHQSCSKRPKPTVDVDLGNSRSFVFSRIDPSPKETPTAGPKAAQGGQQHGQQGGPVAQKASFQGVAKELDRPATAQPSSDAENRGVPGLLSLLSTNKSKQGKQERGNEGDRARAFSLFARGL